MFELQKYNCEDMIDAHKLSISNCEIKAWKKIRPERDSNGAVFCQLSYQAIWELVTLWVSNIPVDAGYKWM